MPQIGYPLEKAREALDEFLNDGERQHNGERYERWISSGDEEDYASGRSEPLAYIVPAEQMHRMRQGYAAWVDSEEFRADPDDLPPGYRPWRHSPMATTDRLLPTEPLLGPLAHAIFKKPMEELEEIEQWRVKAVAISALLRVTLDPDSRGAVPVLVAGHDGDEPDGGMRWQTAFVTEVPGLFVRATGNGFLEGEYAILTGSGYRLSTGWYSREDAARCAAALGRVLPNVDWMRLTPSAFTPASKDAIRKVLKRHGPWVSDTEKAQPDLEPAPEVVVPADSGLPESEPAATAAK